MLEKENETKKPKNTETRFGGFKPTAAFTGSAWLALGIGLISFCIGLWNADMLLNEKGYYFTIILFGLFSVISVQKSVRDRLEGIEVTDLYYGISWFAAIAAVLLLVIGLRNADIDLSEKGFYGMAFTLALFGSIAVQKNTRDLKAIKRQEESIDEL
ncbi:inner membrane protein YiaA [Salibacteraceae bacterium]|nr:inner membrane protein YiaA [Salibacteraceae bacterium]